MRLSIWPSANQPFSDVLGVARHAADTGWDGVWVADHFMADAGGASPVETPTLESTALVAALAAAVPRVRLGTLVLGNTYRHPAVVANLAATIDQISGGRFTLGIGAGWQENEHSQYGIPLPPVRERVDRFGEALHVLQSLLTQPTTTFEGEHYRLADAVCEPKPVQQPLPVLVGTSGEKRMMRLVAERADGWNCWGTPDRIRQKAAALDAHCADLGRDPATIHRSAQALVFVTEDVAKGDALVARVGRPAIAGPPSRLAESVAAYVDAGVDELIVPDFTLGTGKQRLALMDTLIGQVAADFR
jgi:F420-dependent oxidoreductase-like protein